MDINKANQAFATITYILTKEHPYISQNLEWLTPYYFDENPFSDSKFCEFFGSPGITASIGPFLYRVLEDFDAINEMILHYLPETHHGKVIGHVIYAEVALSMGTNYLCGGMTDFSGEGGRGYRTVDDVFSFLSQSLSIERLANYYTPEQATKISADIEMLYNRAWQSRKDEEAYEELPY